MHRMKPYVNRHRLMAALMISSQFLLTAFVVYWLIGQYREEYSQLHEELSHEYSMVHDQLVDSMLMKNLVLPSLDVVHVKVGMHDTCNQEIVIDSVPSMVMAKQFFARAPDEQEMINMHLGGLVHIDSGVRSIDISTIITDEERMVRSVKLFINENQKTFRSDTGLQVFTMKLDSSDLVEYMENALEKKEWTFSLDWPGEAPGFTDRTEIHGLMLDGGPNRYLPALLVQQYKAYLIQSVLPQILFAMILLVLSASALLFAYRSLLRQLALNRLRDDFIGNVSHELKTPVSTIKVALEALSSFELQKDPKRSDEYLQMASSELGRLERLVGKVLHHEMLNNPSLVLEKEDCDLVKLARSVVRTLDHPIREARAKVTVKEEGISCKVSVDRVYVEGMIMNLIDNGLKYTGEFPQVQIMIIHKPSASYLSVSDKGPGIPEEYKDQVFEKFFRIPTGNRHNVKGYGLGLNFAAQVMVQHGGRISFHNQPEGGCCFTLEFPRTST